MKTLSNLIKIVFHRLILVTLSLWEKLIGAVQRLRNGQRGGGGRRFCYISLRIFLGEGGGILLNSYVTVDTEFENSKCPLYMRF